jgi:catechol 2,3-dioxygenase
MAFYAEFLNLRLTEKVGNGYAFLTGGGMHHEIALQNVGPQGPGQRPYGTGLYHVAFEVPDRRSLAEAYFKLTHVGVSVVPVDHLISWAIYFSDPDGNELEIYWDARETPEGERLWRGRNRPIPEEDLYAALSRTAAAER